MSDPENSAEKKAAHPSVWQSTLAEKLGVSTEDLRELRDEHLTRGTDWDFDSSNHVILTEAAAQKLAGLILATAEDPREPAALPASALRVTDARLRVTRSAPMIVNPKVLEARLEAGNDQHGAGTVVTVRVRDNKLFRSGDEITARYFSGILYDLTSKPPKRRV